MTGSIVCGRREPTDKMLDYARFVERWTGVERDAAVCRTRNPDGKVRYS